MKYFFQGLGALLALCACQHQDLPEIETAENEKVYINLAVSGELGSVRFSDVPLGGRVSSGADDSTYLIVFVEEVSTGPYALGIFDHIPDSLPLGLNVDETYEFDLYGLRAGQTFGLLTLGNGTLLRAGGNRPITNDFVFGQNFNLNSVGWYTTADSATTATSNTNFDTPIDVYFGEESLDTSVPLEETLSIDMVRNVFAYDLIVTGLTSGALEVNVGATSTLFAPGNDSTEFFIRSHRRQFWSSTLDFPANDYEVEVIKYDTIGPSVVPTSLFLQDVGFTRLNIKTIQIDATSSDQERSVASLDVTFEDTPLARSDTLFID